MSRARAVVASILVLPAIIAVFTVAAHAQATSPAGSQMRAVDPVKTDSREVANAGLQTPESVLHDASADVYLVSNINGVPSAKDNNGFIARVRPDGTVATLKWIEGGQKGVTLHAPKGLAVHGDVVYVTDIDCVRRFNRTSGAPAGETCIAGATFLNDVSVAGDGTVYVTDTGIQIDANGAKPTGTDAVYRLSGDQATPVIKGPELRNPNGIVASADGLIVVPFGSAEIFHIDANGTRHVMGTLPAGQLDGLVRLADGTLIVTSWEGKAVYRRSPDGRATALIENVSSPADLGYDAKRRRVLVPVFTENRLIFRSVQ